MDRSFHRRAGLLVLAMIVLALLPAPARAQEQGLFELRLTALPNTRTLVVLVDAQGQPLVPLRPVIEFLEIPVAERGDTLALEWPPGVWSTRVHLPTREVRVGDAVSIVPEAEWVRREGEVYLSPAVLGRVLAGDVAVDWENLSLIVGGRADYPVVARARNAARREGDLRGAPLQRRSEPDVAYPARTGGATAGWGVSGTWADGDAQGSARAALGVGFLGGALEGGATAVWTDRGDGLRVADPYGQYARAFPRSRWIRQLQLGDILSDGLVTRPYFGFAASNEPLYTPQFFGEALIRPVVPAGWEYEVYQGEYLVGVSTPGSTDPVTAPLGYGTTPVRVRLIGPAGQERVEELTFLVPAIQVPPGEWRWYLGAGACRHDECSRFGYADLRRGLSRALTAGVGLDHLARGDSVDETRPYGILAWNPTPSLRTEVRARSGSLFHAMAQRYGATGGWQLSGGWRREEVGQEEGAWFAEGSGAWRIPRFSRTHPLGASARLRGREDGGVAAWQAGVTSGIARVRLAASYESGFQPRDVFSLQANAFVGRRLPGRVRDLNLTGRLDFAGGGVDAATLGTTFRPGEGSSVTASFAWYADGRTPALALSLITRTPAAYVQASAFRDQGRSGTFASAGGGVAWGARVGWLTSPFETLGRGGVSGYVFHDEDGDGVFDAGEEVAGEIPVVVGGERAVSDDRGLYRAWGVLPYAVTNLSVDTLNVASTDIAPARPEYLIRPTPNLYTRVDLPLLRTREVAGRVRWRTGRGPLGGITVEAVREGESQPRRATTFSDGEFYFTRLRAGRWELRVAASSLQALNASAAPPVLRFEVPAGGRDVSVQLDPVWLLREGETVPDSVPEDSVSVDSIPTDSIPSDSIPSDSIPGDSIRPVPGDTVRADSIPAGAVEVGRGTAVLGRVYFDFDRATLRADARATLDSVAAALADEPSLRVHVDGHADAVGASRYNDGLAAQRARAVADYLASRGVDRARMTVRAFGETVPAAPNRTLEGRRLNRRGEVSRAP